LQEAIPKPGIGDHNQISFPVGGKLLFDTGNAIKEIERFFLPTHVI